METLKTAGIKRAAVEPSRSTRTVSMYVCVRVCVYIYFGFFNCAHRDFFHRGKSFINSLRGWYARIYAAQCGIFTRHGIPLNFRPSDATECVM